MKPVHRIEGSTAASYMMIYEEEAYVTIEQEAAKMKKKQAEKKPQKDQSYIKRFPCDQMGHYLNKCPNKINQDDKDDRAEAEVHTTWHEEQEASMLMMAVSRANEEEVKECNNSVHATEGLVGNISQLLLWLLPWHVKNRSKLLLSQLPKGNGLLFLISRKKSRLIIMLMMVVVLVRGR